jgi:D-sedoheptulose 7-phosphate isomerase
MLEQRIQQHFIDSADLKYQSAQILSKPIAAAVQALLACVTSGARCWPVATGDPLRTPSTFRPNSWGGLNASGPSWAPSP